MVTDITLSGTVYDGVGDSEVELSVWVKVDCDGADRQYCKLPMYTGVKEEAFSVAFSEWCQFAANEYCYISVSAVEVDPIADDLLLNESVQITEKCPASVGMGSISMYNKVDSDEEVTLTANLSWLPELQLSKVLKTPSDTSSAMVRMPTLASPAGYYFVLVSDDTDGATLRSPTSIDTFLESLPLMQSFAVDHSDYLYSLNNNAIADVPLQCTELTKVSSDDSDKYSVVTISSVLSDDVTSDSMLFRSEEIAGKVEVDADTLTSKIDSELIKDVDRRWCTSSMIGSSVSVLPKLTCWVDGTLYDSSYDVTPSAGVYTTEGWYRQDNDGDYWGYFTPYASVDTARILKIDDSAPFSSVYLMPTYFLTDENKTTARPADLAPGYTFFVDSTFTGLDVLVLQGVDCGSVSAVSAIVTPTQYVLSTYTDRLYNSACVIYTEGASTIAVRYTGSETVSVSAYVPDLVDTGLFSSDKVAGVKCATEPVSDGVRLTGLHNAVYIGSKEGRVCVLDTVHYDSSYEVTLDTDTALGAVDVSGIIAQVAGDLTAYVLEDNSLSTFSSVSTVSHSTFTDLTLLSVPDAGTTPITSGTLQAGRTSLVSAASGSDRLVLSGCIGCTVYMSVGVQGMAVDTEQYLMEPASVAAVSVPASVGAASVSAVPTDVTLSFVESATGLQVTYEKAPFGQPWLLEVVGASSLSTYGLPAIPSVDVITAWDTDLVIDVTSTSTPTTVPSALKAPLAAYPALAGGAPEFTLTSTVAAYEGGRITQCTFTVPSEHICPGCVEADCRPLTTGMKPSDDCHEEASLCPPGDYYTSICTPCLGGSRCPGDDAIYTCGTGMVSSSDRTSCVYSIDCDVGEYNNEGVCSVCPSGMRCPGDNIAYDCPDGQIPSPDASTCVYHCVAGEQYLGGICQECVSNTEYCPGDDTQHQCQTGQVSSDDHTTCIDAATTCPAGQYISDMRCEDCSNGYMCPGDGEMYQCDSEEVSSADYASCVYPEVDPAGDLLMYAIYGACGLVVVGALVCCCCCCCCCKKSKKQGNNTPVPLSGGVVPTPGGAVYVPVQTPNPLSATVLPGAVPTQHVGNHHGPI
ncbi:hypothetical protein KIPB_007015 [Kipferlia bialata]|uniref:TNFR-Cys domain-containing protein n=1 Tax=Kipferlia bialata TaxID=797122 RepID=A0A9K3GK97_9EUKA|nr:hypothetical protein KIPB_007015 [Kipferlia bialata]|eukprot:g7015.t1